MKLYDKRFLHMLKLYGKHFVHKKDTKRFVLKLWVPCECNWQFVVMFTFGDVSKPSKTILPFK